MVQAFRLAGRTITMWWRELILLVIFNVIWWLSQLLIITGPPATATMYRIAQKLTDNQLVDFTDSWKEFRLMFFSAWKWGALNMILLLVLVVNLAGYWNAEGWEWSFLKLIWMFIAITLYMLNLFYWPFWLSQTDQRMLNTYRNSLVLMFNKPALFGTTAVLSFLWIVFCILTVIPLVVCMMAWLALLGVLTVEDVLAENT